MGMSTHIVGFRPVDEKFKQMRTIWEACREANITPPKEVSEFFGHTTPDPRGVSIDLLARGAGLLDCVSNYREDDREGFEIDVRKLPKDIAVIRFFNSY